MNPYEMRLSCLHMACDKFVKPDEIVAFAAVLLAFMEDGAEPFEVEDADYCDPDMPE